MGVSDALFGPEATVPLPVWADIAPAVAPEEAFTLEADPWLDDDPPPHPCNASSTQINQEE